jgi:hypothetical protein
LRVNPAILPLQLLFRLSELQNGHKNFVLTAVRPKPKRMSGRDSKPIRCADLQASLSALETELAALSEVPTDAIDPAVLEALRKEQRKLREEVETEKRIYERAAKSCPKDDPEIQALQVEEAQLREEQIESENEATPKNLRGGDQGRDSGKGPENGAIFRGRKARFGTREGQPCDSAFLPRNQTLIVRASVAF